MAVIGYARVSTTEQNLGLQLTALQAAGAARTFADNGVTGSTVERPQLSKALDRLETGDVLAGWKLDRLGCGTRHVLDIIENIREQGARAGTRLGAGSERRRPAGFPWTVVGRVREAQATVSSSMVSVCQGY